MTPQEIAVWQQVQRRAATLSPEIAQALLRAFAILLETMPEAKLAALIEQGPDAVLRTMLSPAIMERAFLPVRERIRSGVGDAVRFTSRDLPKPASTVTFGFDILNPRVIDGIRQLETKVITRLEGDVRETFRAYIENGLRDGVSPRTIAQNVRGIIGLAPNQEAAVSNFERMLRSGDREALTRALRDRRFDPTLNRLLGANGEGLSSAQIEKMATAYRQRMIAYNATNNAREASMGAMRLGQRLSVEDAIDRGVYDRDRAMKMRIGVNDARERPAHVAINNQVRRFNEPYSNGEMWCGQLDWGCRCVDRYYQSRAA